MLRTLDRYILKEMTPPFFLTMAALLLVLVLQKLFRIADLVVSQGASLASTAQVLLFVLPGFLVITLPMSLLVAALTAFSRMSADSEVTAMKASRISLYSMIRPVFLFAVLTFAATAATSLVLVPGANAALKAYLFNLVKSRAMVGIEPGIFSNTFEGMVLYVDKMNSPEDMEGVFISDERSAREPYTIVARHGRLIADPGSLSVTLALKDGSLHTLPRDGQSYPLMSFSAARLYVDINSSMAGKNAPGKGYEDMSSVELLQEIDRSRKEGKSAYSPEIELHKRLSIPFACLIFGLIGAPLGIRRTRSGKSAGIFIALVVFLVYYIIVSGAANLARTGFFSPLAAYWIPNGIMAAAAMIFVIKKGQEANLMIGSVLARTYYHATKRLLNKLRPKKFQ